jgi:hypothetical protein
MRTCTQHRLQQIFIVLVFLVLASLLAGCAQTKVSRVSPDKQMDVTDEWNDTDSRKTAKALIEDMMTFPWLDHWYETHDRKPRVIVGTVQNKSHEHIPTDTFINDLKRTMLRTDKVQFVSAGSAREDVRKERKSQELYASQETQAKMAQEAGADFTLFGTISSTVQQTSDVRVTFYQVDMKLVDMTTTEEVWYGQKKIKKQARKSGFF